MWKKSISNLSNQELRKQNKKEMLWRGEILKYRIWSTYMWNESLKRALQHLLDSIFMWFQENLIAGWVILQFSENVNSSCTKNEKNEQHGEISNILTPSQQSSAPITTTIPTSLTLTNLLVKINMHVNNLAFSLVLSVYCTCTALQPLGGKSMRIGYKRALDHIPLFSTHSTTTFSAPPVVAEEISADLVTVSRSKEKKRRLDLTDIFRLPGKIHLAWLAFFGTASLTLRFQPAAKFIESLLNFFPCARWEDPFKVEALSAANWVVHWILNAVSIELFASFYSLMKKSTNAKEKKIYKGFCAVYAIGCIQSILTTLAHGVIGVNTNLEESLENMFRACLRTMIIGSGVSVAIGPWTLLPIFAGVSFNKIGFGNWAGRLLAMHSMSKYLFSKELPVLFKCLYPCVPLVTPVYKKISQQLNMHRDSGLMNLHSEGYHINVATLLVIIFGGMVFSLNKTLNDRKMTKLSESAGQKVETTSRFCMNNAINA